ATTTSPGAADWRPLDRPGSSFASATREVPSDDHALDLVGALEDLHDLHLAHVALDREVGGVAVAAEHLYGVGRDLHGGVRSEQLGHRRLRAVGLAGIATSRGREV